MDLSKTFDCLNHKILIAQLLSTYGFTLPALKLIHSYLSNRKQRVPVNDSYGLWQDIFFAVPQGSTLGLLLFNIFLVDLFFYINKKISNYADDTKTYAVSDTTDDLIAFLKKSSKDLVKWFDDNPMESNPDKCVYLIVLAKR